MQADSTHIEIKKSIHLILDDGDGLQEFLGVHRPHDTIRPFSKKIKGFATMWYQTQLHETWSMKHDTIIPTTGEGDRGGGVYTLGVEIRS